MARPDKARPNCTGDEIYMRNLHVTLTPFANESRLLKQATTLADSSYVDDVTIVALWQDGLAPRETIADGITVIRMQLCSRSWGQTLVMQMLKYIEFTTRVIWLATRNQIGIFNCHALALLPLGVSVKLLTHARLIYDPHELETERAGLTGLRKLFSKLVERSLIRFCDHIFVVGDSIRSDYMQRYGIEGGRITTVMNCPYRTGRMERTDVFRRGFGIPENGMIFLYQGLLDTGRGLETVLQAFCGLEQHPDAGTIHLVVMGYGPLEKTVRKASAANARVHFQPAVPPQEVLRYTASADIGLCLIEPVCLSYAYSLPNKFFEYLACGLGVLASDLPEMRLHAKDFPQISLLENPDSDALISACLAVASGQSRGKDAVALPERYSWEHQGRVMLTVYENYIFSTHEAR